MSARRDRVGTRHAITFSHYAGQTSSWDGRLAHDEVEALLVIRTVQRIDKERKQEARERAKRKAVTLPRAPWE